MTFNENTEITIYTGSTEIAAPLVSSGRGYSLEAVIAAWELEVYSSGSQSTKTVKDYHAIILHFRKLLQERGRDLLYNSPDFRSEIADAALLFTAERLPGSHFKGPLSAATKAKYLAALSSFYDYAYRLDHTTHDNPIHKIKRPKVQHNRGARAIGAEEIGAWLDDIDPTDPAGARDLALLVALIATGRRVREIASLRRKHLELIGKQIKFNFERLKGGKVGSNLLDPDASEHIRYWLHAHYNGQFWRRGTDPEAPVFPSLTTGAPLGYQGIRDVLKARSAGPMGEREEQTKVHILRHSFAMLMLKADAKLTEIQAALGHANLAVTSEYMESLESSRGENKHSPEIASALRLRQLTDRRASRPKRKN